MLLEWQKLSFSLLFPSAPRVSLCSAVQGVPAVRALLMRSSGSVGVPEGRCQTPPGAVHPALLPPSCTELRQLPPASERLKGKKKKVLKFFWGLIIFFPFKMFVPFKPMLITHFLMDSILSIQTTGTGTPIKVRERTTAVAEHLFFLFGFFFFKIMTST